MRYGLALGLALGSYGEMIKGAGRRGLSPHMKDMGFLARFRWNLRPKGITIEERRGYLADKGYL